MPPAKPEAQSGRRFWGGVWQAGRLPRPGLWPGLAALRAANAAPKPAAFAPRLPVPGKRGAAWALRENKKQGVIKIKKLMGSRPLGGQKPARLWQKPEPPPLRGGSGRLPISFFILMRKKSLAPVICNKKQSPSLIKIHLLKGI